MNPKVDRRLLCLRRTVDPGREREYRALWAELKGLAENSGAHAWRFASPSDPAERLEFLEYEAGHDPRREAGAILARLDSEIGAASVEEWLEDR